ncbi:Uncharacterised protein [Mycobacteroides abscessus]|nr:Uncharacterised protein [Mycobacteroides abscessus]
MITIFCAVLTIALLWLIAENGLLRSENTDLRRAVARLSKHPSTYEPEPLPYMQRLYADDE